MAFAAHRKEGELPDGLHRKETFLLSIAKGAVIECISDFGR